MNALVFGPGFVGGRMALKWKSEGVEVFTFSRNPDKRNSLSRHGIKVLGSDFSDLRSYEDLPNINFVLVSLSHDRVSAGSVESVFNSAFDSIKKLVDTHSAFHHSKFFFTSTTGIYQRDLNPSVNESINETSAVGPARPSAVSSYDMEQQLAKLLGDRLTVLRLAGIYHPDRIPGKKLMQQGMPIPGSPDGLLNLIHADDICEVVSRLSKKWPSDRLLNVSDGKPTKRSEFYSYVCEMAGTPAPRYPSSDNSSSSKDSGRKGIGRPIDNSRLKHWLGDEFRFMDWKVGLTSGSDGP